MRLVIANKKSCILILSLVFLLFSNSLYSQDSDSAPAVLPKGHLSAEQIAKHPGDRWYSANRPDYTALDERIKNLAKNEESPQAVARIICEGLETDIEKARAIFDWLAYNISYDTTYSVYSAKEAFKKRKGVCQGYSDLFDEMAKEVGLDSIMVVGTGNGGATVGKGGHAWNLVRLADRDLLLDSCWGAGYVNNRRFTRAFAPCWFDTHPAVFIYTHYPANVYNACITPVLPKTVFDKMAHVNAEQYIPYGNLDPIDGYISRFKDTELNYTPVSTFGTHSTRYDYQYISTGPNLTNGFFILNREVLCCEISNFTKITPYSYDETSLYENDYAAADRLSLQTIARYCNALSRGHNMEECYSFAGDEVYCNYTKCGYRIPTKNEWLLALGSAPESNLAFTSWYIENYGGKIHEVAQTNPTQNQLFDMLGNVNEICWDEENNRYVLMGGTIYDFKETLLALKPIPYSQELLASPANCGLRLVYSAPKNSENQYNLAMDYKNGKLLVKDMELYKQWLNLAVKGGSVEAMGQLGADYYWENTPESLEKAYNLCSAAAESEQHYALLILARMYKNGKYVEQNDKTAFSYFERSAKAGNLAAMYELALYYKNGEIIPVNNNQYFYWLKKCVDGGTTDEDAIIDLARCYKTGTGCDKNEKLAYKMFHDAAEKENASIAALVEYADCLAEGSGTSKNWSSAIYHYKRALAKGSIYAKARLADCAFNACGMERNIELAAKEYQEIIDQGFTGSFYKSTYDRYQYNYKMIQNFDNNAQYFLSLIPKETSPVDYIDALVDLFIESTFISGSLFKESELLAGLPLDVINSKMVAPLKKINDNQELKGKTLLVMSPLKGSQRDKLQNYIFSNQSFTKTKYKVNGEYYNNDEAFYDHYDNIILLGYDSDAASPLKQIFEKIGPCVKNCSEFDFMLFNSNVFTADPDFLQAYKNAVCGLIDKGVVPRIIVFGNKTDTIQLTLNKAFDEAYLKKINVFGTPCNMQGQISCAFRKGKLFIVLLTEKVNGKHLLLYLDETGWAPEPSRADECFVPSQQNLNKMTSLGVNKSGTVTKKGKMVMHYKVCK